jgi:hypothetical protein
VKLADIDKAFAGDERA